jgi:secreted PhoX family phosphatase
MSTFVHGPSPDPAAATQTATPAPADPARRGVLRGGALGLALAALGGCAGLGGGGGAGAARPGFRGVAPSNADRVVVPEGYSAAVLHAWGDPVGIVAGMPAYRSDATHTAAEQALQFGMHHDGMQYFALDGARRGLLVTNHEYTDDGLLHPDGLRSWSAEKVRKSQAAHGISVAEVALQDGRWSVVRPSRFARRITASTPAALAGPAAGHRLMRTAADPAGRTVSGTFANCGAGATPWGTFLSGEENFHGYFTTADTPTADERRWGLRRSSWYRWADHDERFDTVRHPNEPHRFGWVVEVDPADPAAPPVKRTALGRAVHEGAWVAVTRDGRAVVYSGEDARFEYIYKFVSRDRVRPAGGGLSAAQANATLLDHGTLYVARFDADGRGQWLPLVQGQGPLTPAAGFADQGDVVVRTRQASDLLGATKMDRPEWLAIDPRSRWVYCTLTNNDQRGTEGRPGVDAANPRAVNTMGHIIRWLEDDEFDGLRFQWNHLVLAGQPQAAREQDRGNVRGDAFACPDGIVFDPRGLLWVMTDIGARELGRGDMAPLGNNQLLACDPQTAEMRRFLVGPAGCEIAGACFTPDGRTMFVNIQHPGETPGERSDPDAVDRFSRWPDARPGARPRSATVVVRRLDGGIVGT